MYFNYWNICVFITLLFQLVSYLVIRMTLIMFNYIIFFLWNWISKSKKRKLKYTVYVCVSPLPVNKCSRIQSCVLFNCAFNLRHYSRNLDPSSCINLKTWNCNLSHKPILTLLTNTKWFTSIEPAHTHERLWRMYTVYMNCFCFLIGSQ